MQIKNLIQLVTVTTMVLVVSGCTTSQNVPLANKKNLVPGNALIKVERESGFIGGGRRVGVTDNGKKVGALSQGNSIVWQRKPGKMALKLQPAFAAVKDYPPINVNVKPGKTYNYIVTLSHQEGSFIIRKK